MPAEVGADSQLTDARPRPGDEAALSCASACSSAAIASQAEGRKRRDLRGNSTTSRPAGRRSSYQELTPHIRRRRRPDARVARDRVRAAAARLGGAASTRRALERPADLALACRGLLPRLAGGNGRGLALLDRPGRGTDRLARRRRPLRDRLADQLVRTGPARRCCAPGALLARARERRPDLAHERLAGGDRRRARARARAARRRRLDRRCAPALAGARPDRADRRGRARGDDDPQPQRPHPYRRMPSMPSARSGGSPGAAPASSPGSPLPPSPGSAPPPRSPLRSGSPRRLLPRCSSCRCSS